MNLFCEELLQRVTILRRWLREIEHRPSKKTPERRKPPKGVFLARFRTQNRIINWLDLGRHGHFTSGNIALTVRYPTSFEKSE